MAETTVRVRVVLSPNHTVLSPMMRGLAARLARRAPTAAISTMRRRAASTAPEVLERCSSCYIPTSWMALPLKARQEHNHDTTAYTFALPEGQSLELPVCACILLKAPGQGRKEGGDKDDYDGSDAVRPYTPVSDNLLLGGFELLVKRYDGGAVSQYLHSLDIGATVEFRHIPFNIKAQYPFEGKKTFTLLCAGTGVAPMVQVLHKLLGSKGDERKVTLICGNRSPQDILMKDQLDAWAARHPDRLRIVHVIGDRPDAEPSAEWVDTGTYTAEAGWIDEAKVRHHAFAPAEDTLVFVCGLPSMYEQLCGPRNEAELAQGSVLARLGYTKDMVAKM